MKIKMNQNKEIAMSTLRLLLSVVEQERGAEKEEEPRDAWRP